MTAATRSTKPSSRSAAASSASEGCRTHCDSISKAPDGSYWALQSWQQPLPDFGFTPWLAAQKSWWLEFSHWTGPLAQLNVWQGYAQHDDDAIFGTYTYRGTPVYGYGTTKYGVPTDSYGRLLFLDTYNSRYGAGWRRENSFVSRGPAGEFCYAFLARDPRIGGYALPPNLPHGATRGPGIGSQYRFIAEGPGVTPLVRWTGEAIGPYRATNPEDVVRDIRNREHLAAVAKDNPCLKGQFPDPRAKADLSSVQEDFRHGLSSAWQSPETAGGAKISTGSGGLTFSVPAGQPSTAWLLNSSVHWTRLSPAFVDLGATGVPAGMTFSILLVRNISTSEGWYGVQIGNGQLQIIRRTYPSDSATPWTHHVQDDVFATLPYNPKTMRWIFIWMGPDKPGTVTVNGQTFPDSTNTVDVYFASDVDGAWTLAGSAPVVNSNFGLGMRATGDGSAAASLTIDALTK